MSFGSLSRSFFGWFTYDGMLLVILEMTRLARFS